MDYSKLKDSIDGIYAYDMGAVSSGIRDESLRAEIRDYLGSLSYKERDRVLTLLTRDLFMTDESMNQGYTWEDVKQFTHWLDDDAECGLW